MTFRRTSSGLSNQHIFLNVDAIVFVEGGISYSKEEVYEGYFDSSSLDVRFWKGIFDIYNPDKKLQFRAIGSKNTIRSIADDVISGDVKNVYLAMDRDHDSIRGKLKKHKRVFYTYGYSWENDVWDADTIVEVFRSVCIVSPITEENQVKNDIKQLFEEFTKDISTAVCADACLSYSEKAFFPRNHPTSCTTIESDGRPAVNLTRIDNLIDKEKLNKSELLTFRKENEVNTLRDCYGHLLSDYCYRIIVYLIKKWGNLPKIAKHYVNCFAIDKFHLRFGGGGCVEVRNHYDSQMFTEIDSSI